uniref:Uncharacterized protein n=1 Tax=Spermophilus dauricus TaxID=99837 RepID=A0A8C9QT40_SPEDA
QNTAVVPWLTGCPFKLLAAVRKAPICSCNIPIAKAVADAIRISLGLQGIDKIIQDAKVIVIIINDSATILKQMQASHLADSMLVSCRRSLFPSHPRRLWKIVLKSWLTHLDLWN